MISPLAFIADGAQLGANVFVHPFAHIHTDVIIGDGCVIHSNANLYPGTRLGKNCEVFPGAVIGVVPQDLKYQGEETTVEIGDNTKIRECVTIHRGTNDRKTTKIGANCLLMTYVHIAHDCQLGDNVILASYVGLSGHVTIDDYAIIEGKAAAQQFVHIGAHAFIGGASLIRKDVPPYIKAAREPMTFAGVNSIGIRRRGMTEEQIREIEDIYRIIYVQNSNITKGIKAAIETLPESPLLEEIIGFIQGSDKGVIRGLI